MVHFCIYSILHVKAQSKALRMVLFKDGNGARWIDELEDALTRADGSVPRKSQHYYHRHHKLYSHCQRLCHQHHHQHYRHHFQIFAIFKSESIITEREGQSFGKEREEREDGRSWRERVTSFECPTNLLLYPDYYTTTIPS